MKSLLLLALPAVLAAAPAAACQYTQVPEEVGDSSAQFLARRMVAAAATVDLVLVEDDGIRPINEPATGVLTLRSIARLKGNGADRFSLFGTGLTLSPEAERALQAPLRHFTREEDGRVVPFPYNQERQARLFPNAAGPSPPVPMTSCSPPELAAQTGRFYVAMRGEDGRLLGNFPLYEGVQSPAFAFVPVTLDADDYWLRAVVLATSAAPRSGPAILYLSGDADPARSKQGFGRRA